MLRALDFRILRLSRLDSAHFIAGLPPLSLCNRAQCSFVYERGRPCRQSVDLSAVAMATATAAEGATNTISTASLLNSMRRSAARVGERKNGGRTPASVANVLRRRRRRRRRSLDFASRFVKRDQPARGGNSSGVCSRRRASTVSCRPMECEASRVSAKIFVIHPPPPLTHHRSPLVARRSSLVACRSPLVARCSRRRLACSLRPARRLFVFGAPQHMRAAKREHRAFHHRRRLETLEQFFAVCATQTTATTTTRLRRRPPSSPTSPT